MLLLKYLTTTLLSKVYSGTSMFKVGDRVRIRKDYKPNESYVANKIFNYEEIYIITSVETKSEMDPCDYVSIEEDRSPNWLVDRFEKIKNPIIIIGKK